MNDMLQATWRFEMLLPLLTLPLALTTGFVYPYWFWLERNLRKTGVPYLWGGHRLHMLVFAAPVIYACFALVSPWIPPVFDVWGVWALPCGFGYFYSTLWDMQFLLIDADLERLKAHPKHTKIYLGFIIWEFVCTCMYIGGAVKNISLFIFHAEWVRDNDTVIWLCSGGLFILLILFVMILRYRGNRNLLKILHYILF